MSLNPSVRFTKKGQELRLTGPYGYRTHPVTGAKEDFHTGPDYSLASGSELVAPFDGVVTRVQMLSTGYGGRVLIYNAQANVTSAYAHMKRADVKEGQVVKKGDVVGLSGGAKNDPFNGSTTGAHLHVSLIKGRANSIPGKDPANFYDAHTWNWSLSDPKIPSGGDWVEGDTVTFSGKTRTQASAGGREGIVVHNKAKGKINIVSKGDPYPYHIEGQGWISANQISSVKPKPEPKPEPTPTPTPGGIEVGSKVVYNGYARTNSGKGGEKGSVLYNKANGVVNKIQKGAVYPYHIEGKGWFDGASIGLNNTEKPNDFGQYVKVGDKIYFSKLYTQVNGGAEYVATKKPQRISSNYVGTKTVNGKKITAYVAVVSKIYPKDSKYPNAYEVKTNSGGVLGRVNPKDVY